MKSLIIFEQRILHFHVAMYRGSYGAGPKAFLTSPFPHKLGSSYNSQHHPLLFFTGSLRSSGNSPYLVQSCSPSTPYIAMHMTLLLRCCQVKMVMGAQLPHPMGHTLTSSSSHRTALLLESCMIYPPSQPQTPHLCALSLITPIARSSSLTPQASSLHPLSCQNPHC